jgi:hypothetical protein
MAARRLSIWARKDPGFMFIDAYDHFNDTDESFPPEIECMHAFEYLPRYVGT